MEISLQFLPIVPPRLPVHAEGRKRTLTCLGPGPCINFLYTDAPADMHFVDETGAEIPFDQALKNYAKTHPK
jgi:hypothetical protein